MAARAGLRRTMINLEDVNRISPIHKLIDMQQHCIETNDSLAHLLNWEKDVGLKNNA